VKHFVDSSRSRYQRIAEGVDAVDDLSGHNDMKQALAAFVQHCSDQLEGYYLRLIEDAFEGTDRKGEIQQSHNDGFKAKEDEFIQAQKALAEEFNLSLAFEEELKHQ
jgi:hypothetical protein